MAFREKKRSKAFKLSLILFHSLAHLLRIYELFHFITTFLKSKGVTFISGKPIF